MMQDCIEYHIFIGCHDPQLDDELVDVEELRKMVTAFFERKKIDFSMFIAKGGYNYKNNTFIVENTLCISLIGPFDFDIVKLAKRLSMFMNQENALVIRNNLKNEFC